MTPEQLELNRAVARAKGVREGLGNCLGALCPQCTNWAGSRQAYELLEEARLNLDWGGASLPDSGWVYAPDESPCTSSTVQFVHVFKTSDELYPAICRAWLAWHKAKGGGE